MYYTEREKPEKEKSTKDVQFRNYEERDSEKKP